MWEVEEVISSEFCKFVVSKKSGRYRVNGTGMIEARYFGHKNEAIEFAEDQRLILNLEAASIN